MFPPPVPRNGLFAGLCFLVAAVYTATHTETRVCPYFRQVPPVLLQHWELGTAVLAHLGTWTFGASQAHPWPHLLGSRIDEQLQQLTGLPTLCCTYGADDEAVMSKFRNSDEIPFAFAWGPCGQDLTVDQGNGRKRNHEEGLLCTV